MALNAHRSTAKVVACRGCSLQFCPLYGSSNVSLCRPCRRARDRAYKRVSRMARKATERAAHVEKVDPFEVFERDGWACRLCGIPTPRSKRGTYDHDAPELDHVVPLARGGDHTYANTQCACRRCNSLKSDILGWSPVDAIAGAEVGVGL
ncbi:HNH endonuclease [Paraburkholderia franconis]